MTAVPDLDRRLLRLVPTRPVVAALLEDVVILAEDAIGLALKQPLHPE